MKLTLMYYCEKCEHGYRVPKVDPDRKLLTLTMPCPTAECDGDVEFGDPKTVKSGETMSAKVLYEACMGMGFPHERECSPEQLQMLMVGGTVRDLDVSSIGVGRSLIDSIVVEKDDRLHRFHFAMSTKGATIFKTEEVENV